MIKGVYYGARTSESSRILLLKISLQHYLNFAEPNEMFAQALDAELEHIAGWLAHRPAGAIKRLQDSGVKVDLLIEAWIDRDQFDLSLPSSFLLACGKQNIPVVITTND
ncbi:MAG: hypothetical protein ABI700_09520 [Chloroflexota bacterium]